MNHHVTFKAVRAARAACRTMLDASAEHFASPIHLQIMTFATAMFFAAATAEVAIEIARIETAVGVGVGISAAVKAVMAWVAVVFAAMHFVATVMSVGMMRVAVM